MFGKNSRRIILSLVWAAVVCMMATPSALAQAQALIEAKIVGIDLSAPDALGWGDITGQDLNTSGNPAMGGHGPVGNSTPSVNVKAAYDNSKIYMRFEWADSTKDFQNRILTFDGSAWNGSGNEDRLYVAWPIVDGPGREGSNFGGVGGIGCATMCHPRDPINKNEIFPVADSLAVTNCSACHLNAESHAFADRVSSHPSCAVSCHGESRRIAPTIGGGDMIAKTGSAYDIWHWKAQRSNPIGLAEDQSSLDGLRRSRDGINLAPDNSIDGNARYIWISGGAAVSSADPIMRSEISAHLAGGNLAEWNTGTSQYESLGSPVTVASGTFVTRHIHEDASSSDPSANVMANGVYDGSNWAVVMTRDLAVTGESSPGGALTDTDFEFDTLVETSFALAVTDNSGSKHMGVELVALSFEQPVDLVDGPPVVSDVSGTSNGMVAVTWTNNGNNEPLQTLGFAYDLYAGDFVDNGAGDIWFNLSTAAGTDEIDLDFSGAYFVWVGNQYADGGWFPSTEAASILLNTDNATPHTPLGVTATDGGSQVVTLTWTPEVYGTWLYWVIAYDGTNGEWATVNGPLGDSIWQYVVYGDSDYTAGSVDLTVPAAGDYWFFIQGMAWDATTFGEFATPAGLTTVQ